MDKYKSMQIPICRIFSSSGFSIETMPEFLDDEDFDNHSPHVHSFYEILWFKEGEGVHTIDFLEYKVKPDTIFFLSPGQIHHFDHNAYKGISIKMCTDFMKGEDWQCGSMLKYNIFHNFESSPRYDVDEETALELDALVNSMERELKTRKAFGSTDILQSLTRMFLIYVYRHNVSSGMLRLDMLKPSHILFVRFRSMVEEEYMHMHSVQEYAKRLNVAVRTLNKCVNDCCGMSPLAFINNRVMLEARRLVRYSSLMIKEIAFSLGYDDPAYFVKLFKRHTGYMPSEFREADNVIQ